MIQKQSKPDSVGFWIVSEYNYNEILSVVKRKGYQTLWAGRPGHAKLFTGLNGHIFKNPVIGPFKSTKAAREYAEKEGIELLPN